MWENATGMSSTPTEQLSPVLSAIMTDLVKAQPTNTLVTNFFQSNIIKLEHLAMQTNAVMNAKKEGGTKTFVIRSVVHNRTRRLIHDSIVRSTKKHQNC